MPTEAATEGSAGGRDGVGAGLWAGVVARLMRPGSVAIVGAHPEPTSIGGGVLANLEAFGYAGAIHLVSRSRTEIRGRPCVASIADLPPGIDVALLIVPQAVIRESVLACIARQVGAIVIFSSGFAEAGEEGRRQQDDLARLCAEAGIALMGPNCMGYTNYVAGIPLTFEPLDVRPSGPAPRVAIIAQSGATAANIRFALQARGIAISDVVATGNEAMLGAEDFIAHALDDPDTAVIAVYVEQIREAQRFLALARRARAAGRPIVMLHPGTSARGRTAALSHTGALAGDHAVMQAMARRDAVVVVDTLDELFDSVAILIRFPRPAPGAAGVATNSGAIRGLCFDFCESIGLPLATLSDDTLAGLRAQVPPFVQVDNPFDVGTTGFSNPDIFGASAAILLGDPAVGMVLQSHAGGSPPMQRKKIESILPVYRDAAKPLILNIIGDDYPLDAGFVAAVRDSGIPFFRSPERALRAMKVVGDYAAALTACDRRSEAPVPQIAAPPTGVLTEYEGKRLLRTIGLATPEGALVTDVEQAVAVAAGLGGAVVLKAQAAALSHKSDAGAVILGLEGPEAVRAGWDRLHANLADRAPGVRLDGVLVEQMAAPGLELVIGARRDPDWGPVVLVGLGGVWIEVLRDSRLMSADIDLAGAMAEIGRLRAAPLLGAFRGQPARDVAAVAGALVQLGALMRAQPALSEIDINPLVVGAEGQGAVALDALVVVGPATTGQP